MRNKKGFTIVEVLISFFLIVVVMIYLLRTIIAIGNKNSELMTYQEFSVYENNLLDTIYKDIDPVYDMETFTGIMECLDPNTEYCSGYEKNVNEIIRFKDVGKSIILNRNDRTIIYDGVIYKLPDGVDFRDPNSMFEITKNHVLHDYSVLTIKLKVRDKDEDIKIVCQNKYSNNVNIIFDANGGTPAITELNRKIGETLGTLPTVTYTNHDFAGWYTERDAGELINQDTIPDKQDNTYYAHWISQEYTINYYDGNTKLGSSTHEKGISKNLMSISELGGNRSGYTFDGWTASTTSTSKTYTDGQSVLNLASTNGVLNLYAIWKRNANFYSGISKSKTATSPQYYNPKGDKYSVTTPTDITNITGWTNSGWREDTLATIKTYNLSSTITSNKDKYYLVYSRTLTMKYAGNGNTSGSVSQHTGTQYYNTNGAITNVEFTLKINAFVNTGKYFRIN